MDAQVIVVGAGPAGLLLAAELQLGGAHAVVLERRAEPAAESRASTLHARTMEIFDQRGLLAHFGTPPHRAMGHFGGIPLDLGGTGSRYPGQWTVPQTRVEAVLAQRATALGADIRRGHDVTGVDTDAGHHADAGHDTGAGHHADASHVAVDVTGPSGPTRLTASYVAGCDGEDSTVRRAAGIPLSGTGATRQLLRADIAGVDIPARRFQRLPAGLAIAGQLPSGATRVMVAEHAAPAVRGGPVTFEEVAKAWQRVTGEDISAGTPLWLNAFDNASLLADRYRAGRVLLAGDAAHLQMPSGGQAINLGLAEAANLGWKLAAEACGHAPAGLLDTYHAERHPAGRRVLDNIAAQSALLLGTDTDPLRTLLAGLVTEPRVRDLLAGTISGLDVRYEAGEHPLTGTRMPHVALGTGAGTTSTTELLRAGRGLLLDLSDDPGRAARLRRLLGETAPARGRRVDLVPAVPAGPGPDPRLAGLGTVLLRPDGHVAWAGPAEADPGPALRRWFG